MSDELNGVTQDNAGNVRPLVTRSFASLSQAEEENGQCRIYLGIHWSFDKTAWAALWGPVCFWWTGLVMAEPFGSTNSRS